jgi:hypothetical protein
VVTGTDAGTEFGEDDQDVEMKEPSPGKQYSLWRFSVIFSMLCSALSLSETAAR